MYIFPWDKRPNEGLWEKVNSLITVQKKNVLASNFFKNQTTSLENQSLLQGQGRVKCRVRVRYRVSLLPAKGARADSNRKVHHSHCPDGVSARPVCGGGTHVEVILAQSPEMTMRGVSGCSTNWSEVEEVLSPMYTFPLCDSHFEDKHLTVLIFKSRWPCKCFVTCQCPMWCICIKLLSRLIWYGRTVVTSTQYTS